MIRYHSYKEKEGDELCYRTIISFPTDELYDQYLGKYTKTSEENNNPVEAQTPVQGGQRRISAISNKVIRYRDPLTLFPYSDPKEFSIIRDSYIKYLDMSSLKDHPVVKKFIEQQQQKVSRSISLTNPSTTVANTTTSSSTQTPPIQLPLTSTSTAPKLMAAPTIFDQVKYTLVNKKIPKISVLNPAAKIATLAGNQHLPLRIVPSAIIPKTREYLQYRTWKTHLVSDGQTVLTNAADGNNTVPLLVITNSQVQQIPIQPKVTIKQAIVESTSTSMLNNNNINKNITVLNSDKASIPNNVEKEKNDESTTTIQS